MGRPDQGERGEGGLTAEACGRVKRGRGVAMAESESLKLGERPLRLADLRRIYEGPVTVTIDPPALARI